MKNRKFLKHKIRFVELLFDILINDDKGYCFHSLCNSKRSEIRMASIVDRLSRFRIRLSRMSDSSSSSGENLIKDFYLKSKKWMKHT